MNELVTCLCLTKNRKHFLPTAIDCFLRQTYVPRELVIVADCPEDLVEIPRSEHAIRIALFPGVIGMKRNGGCTAAEGRIVAHWDDDDYSAPGRLARQVAYLDATGKSVTGFSGMHFTDGENWWRYQGWSGWAFGNSLCYRKSFWVEHPFPEIQSGEDQAFVHAAVFRRNALTTLRDEKLMYATIHAGNTAGADPKSNPSLHLLPGFEWRDAA